MSDLLKFADELKSVLHHLPDLLSYEQEAAARAANIERLKADGERLIASYKAQALADAKGEVDTVLEKARADGRKLLADAQAKVDAIDAEVRTKLKLRDQIVADIERGEAKLQEFHRVRRSLVG